MIVLRLTRCAALAALSALLVMLVTAAKWDLDSEGPGGAPG